jgi:hypothetical protein
MKYWCRKQWMPRRLAIAALLLLSMMGTRTSAQTNRFTFDFGTVKTAKGCIAVTPDTIATNERGYGLHPGSALEAIDRGGNPVKGDCIKARQPFLFSVRLPEGNYDIKVTLGDRKGVSATSVRAECRRLLLEGVDTKNGKIVTKNFTVHLRDSLIRDPQHQIVGKVKLKPREKAYLHWDQWLTLEFNNYAPAVCAVAIKPNTRATTVFLAGNSTVVDQDREPWAAWVHMIAAFF